MRILLWLSFTALKCVLLAGLPYLLIRWVFPWFEGLPFAIQMTFWMALAVVALYGPFIFVRGIMQGAREASATPGSNDRLKLTGDVRGPN